MESETIRIEVLRAHGATDDTLTELLAYTRGRFQRPDGAGEILCPLDDEPGVEAWERYAREAERVGTFECLRERLVQLRFPIRRGISAEPAYRDATRRGGLREGAAEGEGLRLNAPGELRLLIHPTPAGRVPVLVAGDRSDFESLLQALTCRNEPTPIPPSVGAMMVAGYNNWDRIGEQRHRWQLRNPGGDWNAAFRELIPHRDLYQDRFVVLSRGPYSGTAAAHLGFTEASWLARSLTLRLDHECAHYFTKRVFGSMENSLQDELIADYLGIVAAAGRFRADWFLRFLGLEAFPRCRPDGRLATYRGNPPLSEPAFRVLQALVKGAAEHLEAADFSRTCASWDMKERARALWALAMSSLEEMAAEDGLERLRRGWEEAVRCVTFRAGTPLRMPRRLHPTVQPSC